MNPTPVDRCFCHEVTFARIVELARESGANLQGLSAVTGCCTGCGLCRPYVETALRTGIVRFPALNVIQLRSLRPLPGHTPLGVDAGSAETGLSASPSAPSPGVAGS